MFEPSMIENEIKIKAKEWIEEYGEDFLVELIDVFLDDTPARMAQLRRALDGDDNEAWIRESHTLKSSCANVGAMVLAGLAKQMEFAGRNGKMASVAGDLQRFEEQFLYVKKTLEGLRGSAAQAAKQQS